MICFANKETTKGKAMSKLIAEIPEPSKLALIIPDDERERNAIELKELKANIEKRFRSFFKRVFIEPDSKTWEMKERFGIKYYEAAYEFKVAGPFDRFYDGIFAKEYAHEHLEILDTREKMSQITRRRYNEIVAPIVAKVLEENSKLVKSEDIGIEPIFSLPVMPSICSPVSLTDTVITLRCFLGYKKLAKIRRKHRHLQTDYSYLPVVLIVIAAVIYWAVTR